MGKTMPYTYVEAPTCLEHQGVEVCYTFKDGFADDPPNEFWFSVGDEEFDVRDLPVGPWEEGAAGEDRLKALLRQAIDSRILTQSGVDWTLVESTSRSQD